MVRILYALTVFALLGASAMAARNLDGDSRPERGAAILMLAGMPR